MGYILRIGACLGLGWVFAGCETTDQGPSSTPAPSADRFMGDLTACPVGFSEAPRTGQHANYQVGDQPRSFYLHLPSDDALMTSRPVVVMFNGTGGNGQGAYPYYNGEEFTRQGFITIAPDSAANGSIWPVWDSARRPDESGKPNRDLDYVDNLLRCLAAHYPMDRQRIYAIGQSAGGIMTNRVLRSRPDVFAGGIVASSVFDFTAPDVDTPMKPMAVVVTWGGENDGYSGESDREDVSVPEFNFAEQAALASAFYHDNRGAHMWVRGADIGHRWVAAAGPAMIRFLLAHPKGFTASDWTIEPLPDNVPDEARFSWGVMKVNYVPKLVVECATDAGVESLCQSYCQLVADCAIENSTVGPVLGPQLTALGFTGDRFTECGGCMMQCITDATQDADDQVLSCLKRAADTSECGGGVDGVMPLVNAVNACCDGRASDSGVCQTLCGSVLTNSVVVQTGLFSSCDAYEPIP